ncbi:MAG: hypothetical protein KF730_08625 [Sphingomonas sp.]|uniref:hypothetical protein n=1 Tax=Sphingomonas sp. TaxID=28214 RepID=UPI0025CC6697|nr:hypothetical protein [Sphingomonas sp.]MBX3564624.1 hypothetical protein [Sphingomonas sp.]
MADILSGDAVGYAEGGFDMTTVGKIRSFDELDIFTMTGTVVGQQGRTSTHLSAETTTHGGGGYLHQGSGFISAPTTTTSVSSSSTHHQRLFARKDDGDEFDVEFPDVNFGIREGHRVSVVCAGPKRTGRGHPMALINHTTGNQQVFPARVNWILSQRIKPYAIAAGSVVVVLALIANAVSGRITGGIMPLVFLIGIGVVGWEIFRWLILYRKVRLEVESTAQTLLRNGKEQARAN